MVEAIGSEEVINEVIDSIEDELKKDFERTADKVLRIAVCALSPNGEYSYTLNSEYGIGGLLNYTKGTLASNGKDCSNPNVVVSAMTETLRACFKEDIEEIFETFQDEFNQPVVTMICATTFFLGNVSTFSEVKSFGQLDVSVIPMNAA